MSGVMFVEGPCFTCGHLFAFDPDGVPSVPIDPETGLSPDLGGDAARAVRQPLCPVCCKAANVERRKKGLPLWDERDSLARMQEEARW